MPREMERWFQLPAAVVAAVTAVAVALIMVGGFAITYDPMQPDGSIDNVPARALGVFLLGTPATLLLALVVYLIAFNFDPPIGVVSRRHCLWALSLAVAGALFLAVSARDSFDRWYEAFYLAAMIPLLFAPLEAGFLVGSAIGNGITSRCSRRGELRRAAERPR